MHSLINRLCYELWVSFKTATIYPNQFNILACLLAYRLHSSEILVAVLIRLSAERILDNTTSIIIIYHDLVSSGHDDLHIPNANASLWTWQAQQSIPSRVG